MLSWSVACIRRRDGLWYTRTMELGLRAGGVGRGLTENERRILERLRRNEHTYLDNFVFEGIEAHYTYNKTSYKGGMTSDQIAAEVTELYGDRVRFISCGSDYHNDAKKGVTNARELGEAGLTWEEFEETPIARRM